MWKVIQEVLPILLVVLLISQYVIPVVFNGTTWWLFKPEKKKEVKSTVTSTLLKDITETKAVVDETKVKVEVVKNKVKENLKTAEDLKKEADKLN